MDPEDLNSSIVRYVSHGVVLNYQNAKALHNWLGEQIEALEGMLSAREEIKNG